MVSGNSGTRVRSAYPGYNSNKTQPLRASVARVRLKAAPGLVARDGFASLNPFYELSTIGPARRRNDIAPTFVPKRGLVNAPYLLSLMFVALVVRTMSFPWSNSHREGGVLNND